ncbi:MAG: FtsW/RodA/SpoVE family cell cycle protein [Gammaproteobacteria bacterium]|nr:FtsW/RodA/SpoVE family cell cycle protein [Gammaproteobacteria bacterium]
MQAVIARAAGAVRPNWRGDPRLAGVVTALLAFSVVMVFSVTVVDGDTAGASFDRILRHVVYIGIGVAAMLAAAFVPIAFWQRWRGP